LKKWKDYKEVIIIKNIFMSSGADLLRPERATIYQNIKKVKVWLMQFINNKVNAIKNRFQRNMFNRKCNTILGTDPLHIVKDNAIIISMLRHSDVIMYLIAIKSFYKRFSKGEIVILNDGSLDASDLNLLKEHVLPKDIVHINDIKNSVCPKGGCWERILLISEYVKDYFVIQLDADTLTLGDIPEVHQRVSSKTSFALPTKSGQSIETMKESNERIKHWPENHVQVKVEKKFNKLVGYENLKYVRGSAAFAGFATESFTLSKLENFSQNMYEIIGKDWTKWGTEQLTSNFLVANSLLSEMLPYPKYTGYYPPHNISYENAHFMHFAGHHRWANGFYVESAKNFVDTI